MRQPQKKLQRPSIISKRRMQESADTWFDFFMAAFLQEVDGSDGDRKLMGRAQYKIAAGKAREIADIGLEEYEDRWPGLH